MTGGEDYYIYITLKIKNINIYLCKTANKYIVEIMTET